MAHRVTLKRTLRWLAALSLVAMAILGIASWFVAGSLVASANRLVGSPPEGWDAETVTIPSGGGGRIAGWFFPAEDAQATLLLLHPLRADRRSMLTRAKLFHEAGYSTLLIDLQAHGETAGRHITVGHLESQDVNAAVDWIRERSPDQPVGVVGWSLGGATALLAHPLDIDAMVLESVYPTIAEAVHDRVAIKVGALHHLLAPSLLWQLKPRLGISPAALRPIECFESVQCPVLIAAGDNDRHTTLPETKRMFETAQAPKRLVVFQGAAHTDLLRYDRDTYLNEVLAFLAAHLKR